MKNKIRLFRNLTLEEKTKGNFVLLGEESVRCKYLPSIRRIARENPRLFVLVAKKDLKKGSRGLAKALILSSWPQVKGIVVCENEELKLALTKLKIIKTLKAELSGRIKIRESALLFDRKLIQKALALVSKSNCWWRPTACLFAQGKKIIMTAASKNPWQTNCQKLNLSTSDIKLDPQEQISFCDAIHAEKLAIARAAKEGIPLNGSTLFTTVCPCEECAKELIESGIKRVVFFSEYYNQNGLLLLQERNIKIAKVKSVKF